MKLGPISKIGKIHRVPPNEPRQYVVVEMTTEAGEPAELRLTWHAAMKLSDDIHTEQNGGKDNWEGPAEDTIN
jgi:hypothetical protein